jgi:hypothetical protein
LQISADDNEISQTDISAAVRSCGHNDYRLCRSHGRHKKIKGQNHSDIKKITEEELQLQKKENDQKLEIETRKKFKKKKREKEERPQRGKIDIQGTTQGATDERLAHPACQSLSHRRHT